MSKISVLFSLIFAFLLTGIQVMAQSEYFLKFSNSDVIVTPRHYFMQSVIDRRQDPKNNGKVLLASGKSAAVVFENSTQSYFSALMKKAVPSDTSLAPLHLVIDKLSYTDAGTISRHSLTLNVNLAIVRIIEGKEFVLYESKGSPNYTSRGVTDGLAEKLLLQVLTQLFTGFDAFVNENPDQQTLCTRTEAIFAYDSSFTDYETSDTIRWTPDYKLKWDDFQGKADPSSKFSAQSNCMFSYKSFADYDSGVMRLSLYLYPCFTKKASWVVAENKQDGLLRHEQLHFDICELHIRRLRQAIQNTKLNLLNPSEQIKEKFEQAWNDYQKAQAEYDLESQHGLIEKSQKYWEEKVNKELKELQTFASP
ncbi:MAG: hypothetical protein KA444_00430 [Bacteroidia bacterium]|nr:hypothetical protein [Bacteroidia bacterium]